MSRSSRWGGRLEALVLVGRSCLIPSKKSQVVESSSERGTETPWPDLEDLLAVQPPRAGVHSTDPTGPFWVTLRIPIRDQQGCWLVYTGVY
jgi:hypothetical protein